MNIIRRSLIYTLALTLALTAVACGGKSPQNVSSSNPTPQTLSSASSTGSESSDQNRLSDGKYPVQQASYDDADGEYTVMLLNTKPGDSSAFSTTNLQMAQLTEEEVTKGQQSYLKLENNQASMHIAKDFKIDYVHNVTEEQPNPQTGQTERVIVRQESSFWSPFAGALAGQVVGSLLFRPQYYVPPMYQPGGISGYGGYGNNYNQAVTNYQQRYNTPPAAVQNRQTVRSTSNLRNPDTSSQKKTTGTGTSDRSTGAGAGTNTLRRSNNPSQTKPAKGGFGSGSRRKR